MAPPAQSYGVTYATAPPPTPPSRPLRSPLPRRLTDNGRALVSASGLELGAYRKCADARGEPYADYDPLSASSERSPIQHLWCREQGIAAVRADPTPPQSTAQSAEDLYPQWEHELRGSAWGAALVVRCKFALEETARHLHRTTGSAPHWHVLSQLLFELLRESDLPATLPTEPCASRR